VEQDTEKTKVLFRMDKRGEHKQVTAVFPDMPEHKVNIFTCYAHIGQHGQAHWDWVREDTRPATPEEYAPLKRELEQIGYNLEILPRCPK
jgi:hypothetical protein